MIPNLIDDTLVNLQEEYDKTQIQEVLDELDQELIGLVPVKTRIKEIAALLLIDRLRKNLNLSAGNPGLHMSFTGSQRTRKTTVAMKMATEYKALFSILIYIGIITLSKSTNKTATPPERIMKNE